MIKGSLRRGWFEHRDHLTFDRRTCLYSFTGSRTEDGRVLMLRILVGTVFSTDRDMMSRGPAFLSRRSITDMMSRFSLAGSAPSSHFAATVSLSESLADK